MAKKIITLYEVFEKHVKAGTNGFKDWCAFVAWKKKTSPDMELLAGLEELSDKSYKAAVSKTKAKGSGKSGKDESDSNAPEKKGE